MLHCGLGVSLAVFWSTSSTSTSCSSSEGAPCTLPVIMSSKMPSAVDAMFSCTGIFASCSKMLSSEATSKCSAYGSALTKSDSLVRPSCSWRSVSGDAKPARRKHLVSSRTLFQALLIHRMASKTVTDFANSGAVLNCKVHCIETLFFNILLYCNEQHNNNLLYLTGLKYYHGQYRQV